MKKYIRGKVSKIIDEYTIVLDVTAADGVEEGMIFVVYEEGDELFMDSGESIGKIEYTKATVKIINISSEFSIAESNIWDLDIGYPEAYYDPSDDLFYQTHSRRRIAELKKEEVETVEEESDGSGSKIKIAPRRKPSLAQRIRGKQYRKEKVIVGDTVRSKKPV